MGDTDSGAGGRMPTAEELLAMGGRLPSAAEPLAATDEAREAAGARGAGEAAGPGRAAGPPAMVEVPESGAERAARAAAEAEPGVRVRLCRISGARARLEVEVPFGPRISEVTSRVRERVLATGPVERVDVEVVGVTERRPGTSAGPDG